MQQQEFMNEFWQIILTKAREQGIQVLLLAIAVAYFYRELDTIKTTTSEKIETLQKDLMACNLDRAILSMDVKFLKEAVDGFKNKKR
jgi:hypothetical protein